MKAFPRWRRSAAALAAAAAVIPLAHTSTAGAEPARTATTTKYTRATYLQHALGLPAANTSPVIESVTYDRFQHLLQQPGNFAILIGDPATDDKFGPRAQDVEATAKAAGVKKVYWFNPNLSGNAKVGAITVPNLDIRNPAGITALTAGSRETYGKAWLNLVGQYLGNGVTAVQKDAGTQSATVEITPNTNTVNDGGSVLYDYSGGATPANVQHSYFLIYNRANAQDKIASWIDLTAEAGSASTQAKVTAALNGVDIARVDQFDWWKSEANSRQNKQAPNPVQGGNVPVVTDAANSAANGGWRVNQISYPELVDLLENATDANAVILFGGTWCPNTRAVLSFVNKYAQENDVTVYNFDTVLDGGIVGGGTTSSANPLQSRNNHGNGANPSFLYGEVLAQYLNNLVTQYNPATNGVSYFPNGDTTKTAITTRRLQVPYLVGYQGKPGGAANGGVTRQWIQNLNGTYTEYMSQWYLTNPQPFQINLSAIPQDAPIWATINANLASFTWRTDPATVLPNTATEADDAQYLVAADTATVTPGANGAVSVVSGGANPIPVGPAVLASTLSALGGSTPANLVAAKAALHAALAAPNPDATLIGNLRSLVGAWGVAQNRKNALITAWIGNSSIGGVVGGIEAVRKLEVFFGGLPGGVVSTRTVSAPTVTAGTAPTIKLTIANEHGRKPAGNVSLVVRQGAATVATATAAVVDEAVSFTLPALGAGTYSYTLSYAGDDQLAAFTESGSLTVSAAAVSEPPPPVVVPAPTATPAPTVVARVKASKVAGAVSKAPTSRKGGKYKITITAPKGLAKATGKVTLKLKKGKTTKTVKGTLKAGTVTVSLPKLARGTWKVSISWAGDSTYLAASATGTSIKVRK